MAITVFGFRSTLNEGSVFIWNTGGDFGGILRKLGGKALNNTVLHSIFPYKIILN